MQTRTKEEHGRFAVSMKLVRKVLPDSFRPCTVAVFLLPYEMEQREVQRLFEAHGEVLEVSLLPMPASMEEEHLRQVSFVTFRHKSNAMECIAKLDKTKIPLQIGRDTYHYKIRVKLSHRQDFKQKLQEKYDRDLEQRLQASKPVDPDTRKIQRMARRELRELGIPDEFHGVL